MKKINKNGHSSETAIQLAVIEWVHLHPAISPFIIHIPNESPRTPQYGYTLKKMGMRKGVSDLFIALPRNGYHGAWIEIKSKAGRLSVSQREFLETMQKAGYFTAVSYGIDETIYSISKYCGI